jgi:hypothetical protein
MQRVMSYGRNQAVSPMTQDRAAPRPYGLSGFDILAWGGHGFFPGPRVRKASGTPVAAGVRGLDRIERKAAGHWASRTAAANADSLATVWISVPFAVVFVLGCLTLV